jgi:hypothetical protein
MEPKMMSLFSNNKKATVRDAILFVWHLYNPNDEISRSEFISKVRELTGYHLDETINREIRRLRQEGVIQYWARAKGIIVKIS